MNYDFWLKETILNTTISSHDTPVGLNFFRIRFQMNFNNIKPFKRYKSTHSLNQCYSLQHWVRIKHDL